MLNEQLHLIFERYFFDTSVIDHSQAGDTIHHLT